MFTSLIVREVKLVIPESGIEELLKLEERICDFCGISKDEFTISLVFLLEILRTVQESRYREFMPQGKNLLPGHPEDAPYFALALKLGIPIWSNEKRFKSQEKVSVFTTNELKKELSKHGFSLK